MRPQARKWLVAGAILLLALVFVVLPSMGPLVLADGRAISFPGLRFASSGVTLSESPSLPRAMAPLPVGTSTLALAASQEGAPLEGGTFVLTPSAPRSAKSGHLGRWTRWTKFIVSGQKSTESYFTYVIATANYVSTPTVVATHAGVIDSISVEGRF